MKEEMNNWMENEVRDINWDVTFNITVNGKEVRFDELNESEQEFILSCIKDDYYSGTFSSSY